MRWDNQDGFTETDTDRRYEESQEHEANYGKEDE